MLEADRIELLLRDRTGHNGGCGARAGKTHRNLESIEGAMCAGDAWMAWHIRLRGVELDERQSEVERRVRLPGVVDQLDRPVPDCRNGARVADDDERRQAELVSRVPALGDNFRAYARRIPE